MALICGSLGSFFYTDNKYAKYISSGSFGITLITTLVLLKKH